jgi:hypothetical protein
MTDKKNGAPKAYLSGLDESIPPDFNFLLPSGEVVRGRVWHVTEPTQVTDGHTFSAHWAMNQQRKLAGHKLRWVLIEDVA